MNADSAPEVLDRRQVIAALRSFRRGDFNVRLPEDLQGQDGELAQLFNEVVDLNQQMTAELERLSKVVGKEGKITQRGRVKNARPVAAVSMVEAVVALAIATNQRL